MRSSEFRRASGFFAGGFILAGTGWLLLLIAGLTVSNDPWSTRNDSDAWVTLIIVIFIAAFVAFAIGTVRLVKNLDISNYYNAIHLGRMEYPQAAAQQSFVPPSTPVSAVPPASEPTPTSEAQSYGAPGTQRPPVPPAPPAP